MDAFRQTDSAKSIRFYAFDRVIIGYCLLMVAILAIIGRPLSEYRDEIVFYCTMAAVAAIVIRYFNEHASRFSAFVRLLYPVLMFTFFYRETGGTIFLLFDGFYDWQLTAFEKALMGVNPTLYIDRNLLNVWVNEIFSFCYFSYYFMIPVFLMTLFVRREYNMIKSFLLAACLTFFFSYFLFFLYPIEGPRYYFAAQYTNAIDGPIFRKAVELVIEKGAVHGGCMPSTHFGVAFVILMYCFKYYRKYGWYLLPMVVGLAIGTVWGRFHYISDVIVGGLIGLIAVLLVWNIGNSNNAGNHGPVGSEELSKQNVS